VFHDIMEALCNGDDTPGSPGFQSIGNAPDFDALWADPASGLSDLVFNAMRARGLPNRTLSPSRSTARSLARMAWTALRTPLPFPGGPVRLADVARPDRRAEVSFVVSETLAAGPAAAPRPGAFNGFVDLLFRAAPGHPFCILDWKTNALPDYSPASAAAAMDACGYRLQYRLYALAVADWLGPANLAGAAYLFVRGGETGPGPAVFAEPFPPDWRAAFRASLPSLA
jgi:exodeoxyribonuclease V beta subunit